MQEHDGQVVRRTRRSGASWLRGLLAVNGALLLLLGAVTFGPSSLAQSRARGSYTMVAGSANGSSSDVVYVVDTINQELIAIMYDPNSKNLAGVGYRNMGSDASSLSRGGRGR